jgi:hypothetical protein
VTLFSSKSGSLYRRPPLADPPPIAGWPDGPPQVAERRAGLIRAWPRAAVLALAGTCVLAAASIVLLGSRLTFFNDEWYVLLLRPGLSASTLLEPHNGHLSAAPILIYKGLVAGFGLDDQVPFRITLAAVVLALGVLVFAFVRERAGDVLALIAAVIVLFLGPAWQDLLWSFQIGLVGSLAAGVATLLALERGTRRGDLLACGLLVVAIAFSNLGVSFIVAAAVAVSIRDRRSGLWVPALPALLFGLWWLAYGHSAQVGFSWENVARTPAYVLDAISAGLASLVGLSAGAGGDPQPYAYGRPLLVLAIVAIAFWVGRGGRPSRRVMPIAAAALSFWVLLGVSFIPNWREPETSRYQLISVTFLLLTFAELFRPVRLSRTALAAIAAVAAIAVGANLVALRDGYRLLRAESVIARADLAALDIGRGHVSPRFRLRHAIAGSPYLTGVYAGPYYRERDEHGSPAYSPAELAAAPPPAPRVADVVLGTAYGLRLAPIPAAAPRGTACRLIASRSGVGPQTLRLPPRGVSLANLGAAVAELRLRRFSTAFPVDLGRLAGGEEARLRIPVDSTARRWTLAVSGGAAVRVCALARG